MVQIVNPSIDRVADSFLTAGSLAYAGLKEGGIVPSGQQTELAKQSAADETVLNGFKAAMNLTTDGSPTPDFTVSAGEAFIFGAWVIKDSITQLTAPTNSIITIYVGWDKDSANNVIVGQESDFSNQDSKVPIAEVTSNADGVTDISDIREFVSIDAERLEGKETSEIKPDISDSGATVVENVDDINVEGGLSASNDGDGSATIVGASPYTDTDAINAVDSESSLSVNITGDANTVDGFNFVENGNSASNVINYDSTNDNIDIGGQDIADLSIDGQNVEEVTINGSVTWVRAIDATGGTTVIDRTIGGVDYRIHAFESVGNSTFSVTQTPSNATVDVLVVGGGGGGGDEFTGSTTAGGGGGGGIVFSENTTVTEGSYTIDVGAGGQGGQSQDDDGFRGNDTNALGFTAVGGGGGASGSVEISAPTYSTYGAGGGAAGNNPGDASGAPATSQGNAGGDSGSQNGGSDGVLGGGGGGGTGIGSSDKGGDGGDGGDYSNIFGTTFGEDGVFAGGGGAGGQTDSGGGTGGTGGVGGGGDGDGTTNGSSGTNATGGGGGAGEGNQVGYDGGSGIVLIRYEI